MPESARRAAPSRHGRGLPVFAESDEAIVVVAALAGLGAAFAGTQPTGLPVWDVVLTALFAVVLVLAGSRARSETAVWAAVVAAVASGLSAWGIVAIAAAGVGLLAVLLIRSRLVRAVVVAVAVQALLRIPFYAFFGCSALISAAACVPVLADGYRRSRRRVRRTVRIAFGAAATIALVCGLLGGVVLIQARADIQRGLAAAERGVAAVRAGDPPAVALEFGRAESALTSAHGRTTSLSARLLRILPVVAQHQRAVETMTGVGASISREAATAARDADLDELQLIAGSIDLDAFAEIAPRLRSAEAALRTGVDEISAVRTGWLLPQFSVRIDALLDDVEPLLAEASLAVEAVAVVPGLLGADGPRSYFVMFGTPQESREFGGFIGSWAVLDADGGSLAFRDAGRIRRLYNDTAQTTVTPDGLPPWYLEMARPTTFPQNVTSTPDFRVTASVAQQLFSPAFGGQFDGFIYVDPWAVTSMLELTGPVDVDFRDEPLTFENAPDFFFRGQYEFDATGRNEVFDGLAGSADAVVAALVTRPLPGPDELGRILGPVARAGRLQVVTFDERANELLERVHLLRRFGTSDEADHLAVVQTNGSPSKLDIYLERDVRYEVTRSGEQVRARVSVDLTATVPADFSPQVVDFTFGPDPDGINNVLLSIYTPHDFVGVWVDGEPVEVRGAFEYGMRRYLLEVPVRPDGVTRTVEMELSGVMDPAMPYAVDLWHQPLVNTDDVSVTYRGPDGAIDWSGPLVENRRFAVGLPPG